MEIVNTKSTASKIMRFLYYNKNKENNYVSVICRRMNMVHSHTNAISKKLREKGLIIEVDHPCGRSTHLKLTKKGKFIMEKIIELDMMLRNGEKEDLLSLE